MCPFYGFDGVASSIETQIQELSAAKADVSEEALNIKEVRSRQGNPYRQLLVKWLGKSANESMWISEEELKRVDPAIFEEYAKVLKKIGSNVYLIELPPELQISPVFKVSDLYPFYGFDGVASSIETQIQQLPAAKADVIEEVLNVKEV
ncbi:hypothetical protein GH714_002813 [Hevea brasiliensis]|uniref:Chromo domain-containing protein n=1 Tax=Hevea brasiliensis TaxID=3981 RepID=A0A6A6KHC9_HEVBR|nr:hypothetical protein GH714_002813 [Hevea brasiliensis]